MQQNDTLPGRKGIPGSNGTPTDASYAWQGVFLYLAGAGSKHPTGKPCLTLSERKKCLLLTSYAKNKLLRYPRHVYRTSEGSER